MKYPIVVFLCAIFVSCTPVQTEAEANPSWVKKNPLSGEYIYPAYWKFPPIKDVLLLQPGKFYWRLGWFEYSGGKEKQYEAPHQEEILILKGSYLRSASREPNIVCGIDYINWRNDKPLGQFYQKGYCSSLNLDPVHNFAGVNVWVVESERKPLTEEELATLITSLRPEP